MCEKHQAEDIAILWLSAIFLSSYVSFSTGISVVY